MRFAPNNLGPPLPAGDWSPRRGNSALRRCDPNGCADGTAYRCARKLRTKCERHAFTVLPRRRCCRAAAATAPPLPPRRSGHCRRQAPARGCRLLLAGNLADKLRDLLRLLALEDLGRYIPLPEAVLRIARGGGLLQAAVVDRAQHQRSGRLERVKVRPHLAVGVGRRQRVT